MAETTAPETAEARSLRKVRVGEVVSNKMDKTIVVRAVTRPTNPVWVDPSAYTLAKSPTATPSPDGLPDATVNTPVAATQLPEA